MSRSKLSWLKYNDQAKVLFHQMKRFTSQKKKKGSTHLGLGISWYIMIGNLPHYTSDYAQVVQILLIC
jgi:hypothetical protein